VKGLVAASWLAVALLCLLLGVAGTLGSQATASIDSEKSVSSRPLSRYLSKNACIGIDHTKPWSLCYTYSLHMTC
jgi:hypothetical protein